MDAREMYAARQAVWRAMALITQRACTASFLKTRAAMRMPAVHCTHDDATHFVYMRRLRLCATEALCTESCLLHWNARVYKHFV